MLCDIRGGTYQGLIAHFADLHHIICHEAVSSLDQLRDRLALADAALAMMSTPTPYTSTSTPWMEMEGASLTFIQRMISAVKSDVCFDVLKTGTPRSRQVLKTFRPVPYPDRILYTESNAPKVFYRYIPAFPV